MNNLLEVSHLDVGYGKTTIVRDARFAVQKGEILGIVGESGSGKSTLLKAIMQLDDTGVTVQSGRISFQGQNLTSLSNEEKRAFRGNKMGVVFQNPGSSLNPLRRVNKQFIETMQSHVKIDKKTAESRILELLEKLNLQDGQRILNSYPYELSGGMNQRIALALAMIMEPELLLADEPTSALDVTVQAQVVEEMLKLRDRFGTSIVMITHNMGIVSKMADKIAVMYAGRIVEYGEKAEVIKNHCHPYTRALLEAIPRLDGKRPVGLPGRPPTFHEVKCGCGFASRCIHGCEQCKTREQQLIPVAENHWSCCSHALGV